MLKKNNNNKIHSEVRFQKPGFWCPKWPLTVYVWTKGYNGEREKKSPFSKMTGWVWTRPWCYVWNVLMMSLCLQFSTDSEQYLVAWDRKGMPKDIDRLNNLTVLFTVSVLLECGRFVRKSMCPNAFRLAFESRLIFSSLSGWNKGRKRRLLS